MSEYILSYNDKVLAPFYTIEKIHPNGDVDMDHYYGMGMVLLVLNDQLRKEDEIIFGEGIPENSSLERVVRNMEERIGRGERYDYNKVIDVLKREGGI